MSSVGRRIAVYAAIIAAIALAYLLASGRPVRSDRLLPALVLLPLFALAVWLRWDWRRK